MSIRWATDEPASGYLGPVTRWLLIAAVALSAVTVVVVAPPPKTPPPMRRTEGWFPWWWNTPEMEEPLYRSPVPAAARGMQEWRLAEQSLVSVGFRPSDDAAYHKVVDVPLTGSVRLDTRDLDSGSGRLSLSRAALEEAAGLSGSAAADDGIAVEIRAVKIGTAPRFDGAEAWGVIEWVMPNGDSSELETVVVRGPGDRLAVSTLSTLGWSVGDDGLRWSDLAVGWGLDQGLDRVVDLSFELHLVPGGG